MAKTWHWSYTNQKLENSVGRGFVAGVCVAVESYVVAVVAGRPGRKANASNSSQQRPSVPRDSVFSNMACAALLLPTMPGTLQHSGSKQ